MNAIDKSIRGCASLVVGLVVWGGGCSTSSKEGITVSVVTEAPRSPAFDASTRTFVTDSGVRVTLTRGFVSTGSVQILACASAWGARSWRRTWMREAHAHTEGSPTLLGIPAVESLLADPGSRMTLGQLQPPAGTYCRVKHLVQAADPDALGLPSDGSMLGKSLLVEGTYVVAGTDARPFRFASSASFDVTSDVDPVSLSVDDRRLVTMILTKTGDRWFDRIDWTGDPQEGARRLLENMRASFGARFE